MRVKMNGRTVEAGFKRCSKKRLFNLPKNAFLCTLVHFEQDQIRWYILDLIALLCKLCYNERYSL